MAGKGLVKLGIRDLSEIYTMERGRKANDLFTLLRQYRFDEELIPLLVQGFPTVNTHLVLPQQLSGWL